MLPKGTWLPSPGEQQSQSTLALVVGKESTAFMQLPGKEEGQFMLERPKLPDVFQVKVLKSTIGVRVRGM